MIISLILLAIGLILTFIATHFESKSINVFIAESSDQAADKDQKIRQCLRNYRAVKTKTECQQIRDSQSIYWDYRTKKLILAGIGLVFIFAFCIILAFIISL